MKVEFLEEHKIEQFIEYCNKYKKEIDDSFLYDEDLINFEPNEDNPTYIVTNDNGQIVATASLIISEYNRRGSKGRFRIFHSEVDDIEYYNMLMKNIIKHTEGLNKVEIFIPLVNEKLKKVMETLSFIVERYSYLLVRDDLHIPEIILPEGYSIRTFKEGLDEEVWCQVRNASFAKLKGSETPITPDMVPKMISSNDYIEGGLIILYHNEKPVGVVRGSDDEYEDSPIMNIGPLAIIPEYQRKGLGRILLRIILNFAKHKKYNRTILCVNGENKRAKALYIQEGFKQVEGVVCYKYDLLKNQL